jgi:geranylgeranyl pyrophosphate synthase
MAAPTADSSAKSDAHAGPLALVENTMSRFLRQRPMPANLRDAIIYSLFGPGKRLRPILTIRACEAVGGSAELAVAPAGAIEMIHCFSLVHDDLPAMDDDDLRRGRPTLHRHTNEAMAILAGDAMTSLAFELIAHELSTPALIADITRELALATNDMIAGQVYDTLPDFEASVPPIERLRTIHRHKTGALIRCACRMGAICGSATTQQLTAITRYADAIGLMFQVVDDILDVTQTTEHLGKAANKDADKGKLTYPGLIGLDASRAEVVRLQKVAHEALNELDALHIDQAKVGTSALRELCDQMAVRTK